MSMTMNASVFGGVTSYSAGSASMFQRNLLPLSSGQVSQPCPKGMLQTLSHKGSSRVQDELMWGVRIREYFAPYSPLFLLVQQPHVTTNNLFLFSCTSSNFRVPVLFLVIYICVVLCFLSVPFHFLAFLPSPLPNIPFQVHWCPWFSCIEQDPPPAPSVQTFTLSFLLATQPP